MPPLRNLLIVGGGGRENALAWALQRDRDVEQIWVTPGNSGTDCIPGCKRLAIAETDAMSLAKACHQYDIDLAVIGPEAPLAAGIADVLRAEGLAVFGPGADGARLETSKTWAKELMREAGVPTAGYWSVMSLEEAMTVLYTQGKALVVKADGLASGKGVTVPRTISEAERAIREAFTSHFSNAYSRLVLEERLWGPEVSVFALCDGEQMILLPPVQDHKRLKDGDQGPNTGGMGAYAPATLLDTFALENIRETILEPILSALKRREINYRGVIYAGLMLTLDGPQVIEFNCRFGDPECQVLMPLLGEQLARILQSCALGILNHAPKLTIFEGCSACVVASTAGYPESPRKGDLITINLQQTTSRQIFHAGTCSDEKGNLITCGGRGLAVVAQGENFDEAFAAAYAGMDYIKFQGMHYRRDIGHQIRVGTVL